MQPRNIQKIRRKRPHKLAQNKADYTRRERKQVRNQKECLLKEVKNATDA